MTDNTILIKNALILNPNNFENKKQSLLIKDDLIAEISDEIDEGNVDKIITLLFLDFLLLHLLILKLWRDFAKYLNIKISYMIFNLLLDVVNNKF